MLWQDGKGMEGIWRVRIDWGLMIDWGSIFDRFFGVCVGDSPGKMAVGRMGCYGLEYDLGYCVYRNRCFCIFETGSDMEADGTMEIQLCR